MSNDDEREKEYPQFEAVLAALEIDHIAGGRADGTENIAKILSRLQQNGTQDAVFREAMKAAASDDSGVSIAGIIEALSRLLVAREDAREEVQHSLMWHARDFCCELGREIAKRNPIKGV